MIPNSEDFCFAVLPKSSSTIDEAEGVSSFFSNSVDDIACSVVMRAADNFVVPFSPNSGSDGFDDILLYSLESKRLRMRLFAWDT